MEKMADIIFVYDKTVSSDATIYRIKLTAVVMHERIQ